MLLDRFTPEAPVLIDATTGAATSRADIESRAQLWNDRAGSLVFLLADASVATAIEFHALLEAGIPVALLNVSAPAEHIERLLALYRPEFVTAAEEWAAPNDYEPVSARWWRRVPGSEGQATPPSAELAVLLTTSGSTGSPKFVRLSARNIVANAEQIAQSLGLTPRDRGVTALPIHYSFGMSVLTSHAVVGSPVVVTSGSVIEPGFWQALSDHDVTHLPGVPQTYQMLARLRFADRFLPAVPTLRALMQAGGRLNPDLVTAFAAAMAPRHGEFFVMYGQTEASPRMACLPPARLQDKLGAAGVALAGARLEARGDDGTLQPPGTVGEIFYTGPNVMMGYAESREDLALGDVHGDTLATGDLGYLDDEGFLFLTGRAKRIAKVAGLRVSLDDVEAMAAQMGLDDAVAIEHPEGRITVVVTASGSHQQAAIIKDLTRAMRLPAKAVRAAQVASFPLLASGKIDYAGLRLLVSEDPKGGADRLESPGTQGENDV